MSHANWPPSIEGGRRLVHRCRDGPIAHVGAMTTLRPKSAGQTASHRDVYDEATDESAPVTEAAAMNAPD